PPGHRGKRRDEGNARGERQQDPPRLQTPEGNPGHVNSHQGCLLPSVVSAPPDNVVLRPSTMPITTERETKAIRMAGMTITIFHARSSELSALASSPGVPNTRSGSRPGESALPA